MIGWLFALIASASGIAVAAEPAPPVQPRQLAADLEEITVYSTPLGGLELPIDRVPGNVQQAAHAVVINAAVRFREKAEAEFTPRLRIGCTRTCDPPGLSAHINSLMVKQPI